MAATSSFTLMVFIASLSYVSSVPSNYIPTNIHVYNQQTRDSLIEQYFHLGFMYKDILSFLLSFHGISLSLRQLKRIIKNRCLQRKSNTSNLHYVFDAIALELKGSGSCLGYRFMHQKLWIEYGLKTSRETVRKILKNVDPDGVKHRSKHNLRRRQYRSPGPNFIWHIDGYDKLKPYGFCIHGGIDGYSRKILWLEVGVTNNNPKVIAQYYIDYARMIGGVPRVVRADRGTENTNIAGIQRFSRLHDTDSMAGPKSFMYGKSVSNQRIEGWWSNLRKSNSDWWISFFKDLRDCGLYDDSDPVHVQCLQFCFMPILKSELHQVMICWNLHRIRKNVNSESPAGKPDVLYFLPQRNDTRDYKSPVVASDFDLAEQLYAERLSPSGSSLAFAELAELIMTDNQLEMPECATEAKELYTRLLFHIKNIS